MNLVSELDLPVFDSTAPEFTADAYHAELEAAGRHGWLVRSPVAYIVLDHDSGEFFLRSGATAFPGRAIAEYCGVTDGPLAAQIDANILNLTGDQHRRIRALSQHVFGIRAADGWRPVMRGFLRHLWARVSAYRECDFVPAIARPYPSLTIATVLGAPHQDAGRLQEWSSWVRRQFDVRTLETHLPEIERAVKDLEAYVGALLQARCRQPGDDLISALLAASHDGDRLSAAECTALVMNLLAGAIDTTAGQLALAIRLFAMHPAQWRLLAERPLLASSAVEEVLRFEPVTPFTARICIQDIVHRGVLFPAGTVVAVCAERANREGRDGESFNIVAPHRERLLTFGAGPHHCLGINLARAELEEALAFLAPRMPDLALSRPPRLSGVDGICGIDKLLITWSSST